MSGRLKGKRAFVTAAAAGIGRASAIAIAGPIGFVGFLADMAPFWRDIDLFALSSLWEGFGYVLAEAMLARKPLLAFDCNSMPELVKPGLNGCLAAPPAPGESDAKVGRRLAGLVREMAADPAVMAAMGEAGREFCERNFDQTTAMRSLEEFLGLEPSA